MSGIEALVAVLAFLVGMASYHLGKALVRDWWSRR